MKLSFHQVSNEWIDPTCSAFNQAFVEARSPATWREIYGGSPEGGVSLAAVSESGRVVGHYGATFHRCSGVPGVADRVAQARDTFSLPKYRTLASRRRPMIGQLFDLLCEACVTNGISSIHGFGSRRHHDLGIKLLGYRRIDSMINWSAEVVLPARPPVEKLGSLVRAKRYDDRIDVLEATFPQPDVCRVARSSEFLNWRFSPRPNRKYALLQYDSFLVAGAAGYAVIAGQGANVQLADFRLPDDSDLRQDFWHRLMLHLCYQGARTLSWNCSVLVPESAYFPRLGAVQVSAVEESIPSFFPLTDAWSSADAASRFCLTMADQDTV